MALDISRRIPLSPLTDKTPRKVVQIKMEPISSLSICNGTTTPELQASSLEMNGKKLLGLLENALGIHSSLAGFKSKGTSGEVDKTSPLYEWMEFKKEKLKELRKDGLERNSWPYAPALLGCVKMYTLAFQKDALEANSSRYLDVYSHLTYGKRPNALNRINATNYLDPEYTIEAHEIRESHTGTEVELTAKLKTLQEKYFQSSGLYTFVGRRERVGHKMIHTYFFEASEELAELIVEGFNDNMGLYAGDKEGVVDIVASIIEQLPGDAVELEVNVEKDQHVLADYGQTCANIHTGIWDNDKESMHQYLMFLLDNMGMHYSGEQVVPDQVKRKHVFFTTSPRDMGSKEQKLATYALVNNIRTTTRKSGKTSLSNMEGFANQYPELTKKQSAISTLHKLSKEHVLSASNLNVSVPKIDPDVLAGVLAASQTFLKPFFMNQGQRVGVFPVCNKKAMKGFVGQIYRDVTSQGELKQEFLRSICWTDSKWESNLPGRQGSYESTLRQAYPGFYIPKNKAAQILFMLGYLSHSFVKRPAGRRAPIAEYFDNTNGQLHFYIVNDKGQSQAFSVNQPIVKAMKSADFDFVDMLNSVRIAIDNHTKELSPDDYKVRAINSEVLWREWYFFLMYQEKFSLQRILSLRQSHNENFIKFLEYYFTNILNMEKKVLEGAESLAGSLNRTIYMMSKEQAKQKLGKLYREEDVKNYDSKTRQAINEFQSRMNEKLTHTIQASRRPDELTSVFRRALGPQYKQFGGAQEAAISFFDAVLQEEVELTVAKNILQTYLSARSKAKTETSQDASVEEAEMAEQ